MLQSQFWFYLLCFGIAAPLALFGQTESASKTAPDVLTLTDGEKLIGRLQRATSSSVVFKSDMVGEVTVDWVKVQELQSSRKFAVIPKGLTLHRSEDAASVPLGTITVTGQQVQITPAPQGAAQTVPVGNVANVVEQGAFEGAFHRTPWISGWKGGATGGIALTEATQKNQTFSAAVNLVRTVPSENWLDLRSRTLIDFNEAYGKLTQPNSPAIKTSLYHLGGEEDWYFSPRLFAFGQAVLDHSFSQGLSLQQTYGGGLGFVVFKRVNQEFDVKASVDYIDQRFNDSRFNKQIFGSIFGETYVRKFAHGVLLNEQGGITATWTNTGAYSAFASASATFPVYHRFGLTLGALDNFLNDPPPGFKKNSFQFTAGATYSLP